MSFLPGSDPVKDQQEDQPKDVEMPRPSPPPPQKRPHFRTPIHLAFGVVGVLALLCEGLIIYFLVTTQFNETLDEMITDQQAVLLVGAKDSLVETVDRWLDLSETVGAKFKRRLDKNPSMILSEVWDPAFSHENSSLVDRDGIAIANAVETQHITTIAIHRDGSNYQGETALPVDWNRSDSIAFSYFRHVFPCPLFTYRGEGNETRYHRYCYDFDSGKATQHIGYSPRWDENGQPRRFDVEIDHEDVWRSLKEANGRFVFDWLYVPINPPDYVPLLTSAAKMFQLNDGRNISAMVVNTAEEITAAIAADMCLFKWDLGEFCESLIVGHTNFEILTWGSNNQFGGHVIDVDSVNSTAIKRVHGNLVKIVNGTDSFPNLILGHQTGRWIYSAERIFEESDATYGDAGSLWIVLIYDRDELHEDGDDVAKTAIVTLVVTMLVAAFVYVAMLWWYASRIGNLRKVMRSTQDVSPQSSTELVDDFVNSSNIEEVYQIGREFSAVIHALARADEEKREGQEKQLSERAFLAHMAHDIRTPLHGILGTCEVVLEQSNEPETREYLQTVMHCGDSLCRLLNDSIDLSRMQANKMEVSIQRVDVSEVLKVVHSTFETKLRKSGRSLQMENPSGQHLYCKAESARLVQMTTNLVSNAVKYSKPRFQTDTAHPVFVCSHLWESKEMPLVTKLMSDLAACVPSSKGVFHSTNILTKQVGKKPDDTTPYVAITVTDYGRGIPEDKLTALFSPFAQMRTEDSECGAGLGLNMCFHVAVLLGGFAGVISRPGRGSIFYIAVPVAEEPTLETLREEEAQKLEELETDTLEIDKDNDVILVVDDSAINRKILCRYLQILGFQSTTASDGSEAVDKVREHNGKFYCVITDMEMPHMNGLQATTLMKKDHADLRVICVSGNASQHHAKMAKDAGCVGLVGKPFSMAILKNALLRMQQDGTL